VSGLVVAVELPVFVVLEQHLPLQDFCPHAEKHNAVTAILSINIIFILIVIRNLKLVEL
jgi:hypothetical protein